MATLHENTLNFNKKMTVTNTGGNLSTDAGLVLVKEFLYSIGFEQLMEKELHFQDSRLLPTHSNETILEQLIFQLIAGYDTDASANILRHDPFFQQMLEKSTLASQPSLSRFWDRISESPDALLQLQALNQAMLDKVRIQRMQQNWFWIWIPHIVTPTAIKKKRPLTHIIKQPVIIRSLPLMV